MQRVHSLELRLIKHLKKEKFVKNSRIPNKKNNSSTLIKTELPIQIQNLSSSSCSSSFNKLEQYRDESSVSRNNSPTVLRPRLVHIFWSIYLKKILSLTGFLFFIKLENKIIKVAISLLSQRYGDLVLFHVSSIQEPLLFYELRQKLPLLL